MSLMETFKQSPKALILSLVLHSLLIGTIFISFSDTEKPKKQSNFNPVQARLLSDQELQAINKEAQQKKLAEQKRLQEIKERKQKLEKEKRLAKLKEKQRQERIKQQKIAKQKEKERIALAKKKAKLEKAKLEKAKLEKAKLEKARLEKARLEKARLEKARLEKARLEKERLEKERLEKERLEKERLEKLRIEEEKRLRQLAIEAENKRLEEETKRLAEIARKQKQAQQKAEAERIKKENERRQAQRARELAQLNLQYISSIQQKIARNWRRPVNLPKDFSCELSVRQLSNGEVITVKLGICKGDSLFQQSVEKAAWRASPLPLPLDPELFEKNIQFTFRPE